MTLEGFDRFSDYPHKDDRLCLCTRSRVVPSDYFRFPVRASQAGTVYYWKVKMRSSERARYLRGKPRVIRDYEHI
jgi:hypothetical protein